MSKRFTLPVSDQIRGDQLIDEITQDPSTTTVLGEDDLSFSPPITVNINNVPDGEEVAVQAVVDNHVPDPLYFEEDYTQAQADAAYGNLRGLTQGLNRLDPEDLGYVLLGRSMAKANGASPLEIQAISNKQTAANYIMGLPEWSALPGVAKDWFILSLKAEAIRWQILASHLR